MVHTVSKVGNPTLAAATLPESIDHVLDSLSDSLLGTIQHSGVSVALECDVARATDLDSLGRIVKPVKANDVVTDINDGVESVPCALGEENHGHLLKTQALQLLGELFGDVGEERL